ncbi:Protein 21.6 [Giardia muris]|uniref:Protein 21.6 n=1 Tax=Giardia muris TaxID=5742 RepID=A0A4Z1SPA6_GIAMU|nr:Protein 21.6 [Giardia muris]|eukprot:TNJ27664.1 Protein 21.6 [Giardia muris]
MDYLTTDPTKLRVADLRRAIVEMGGTPEDRATKAALIQQFAMVRSQFARTLQQGQSVPQSASLDLSKYIQGVESGISVKLGKSHARDDLTQSAFDFTGAFNDPKLHAQIAKANAAEHVETSPLRRLKNPLDIERTPGDAALRHGHERRDSTGDVVQRSGSRSKRSGSSGKKNESHHRRHSHSKVSDELHRHSSIEGSNKVSKKVESKPGSVTQLAPSLPQTQQTQHRRNSSHHDGLGRERHVHPRSPTIHIEKQEVVTPKGAKLFLFLWVVILCLVVYQIYSLLDDPLKPQIPFVSPLLSTIFGPLISGPVYRETRTHTSGLYDGSTPCPLFSLCSDGRIVGCDPGYQLRPAENSFYPSVWLPRFQNYLHVIGNRALARWLPTQYASLQQSISEDPNVNGSAELAELPVHDYLLKAPTLIRRVHCRRTSPIANRAETLLQALDTELQRIKGTLICRHNSRILATPSQPGTPLLQTQTFDAYLRRRSLYFTIYDETGTRTDDILPDDTLALIVSLILDQDSSLTQLAHPNLRFQLAEPHECDPNWNIQTCLHRTYVHVLRNTRVHTLSLPRFTVRCRLVSWIRRNPMEAVSYCLQWGLITAFVGYVALLVYLRLVATWVVADLEKRLHDQSSRSHQHHGSRRHGPSKEQYIILDELRPTLIPNPLLRRLAWNHVLAAIRRSQRIALGTLLNQPDMKPKTIVVWKETSRGRELPPLSEDQE